ncbi:MAG TPA: MATE family efflux transporter [Clostridia bacterium]|nr:MATE family efflux transporter [Clostridia bacterium]
MATSEITAVSETSPVPTENKMGVMPISRLLISMSIPMMISMLVQSLYNIVDSIFVSQLGENALTAVSLAFPIQNLMISVGVGTSVGINALLSRSLGERNRERVDKAAYNGIFLAFVSSVVFALFGLFFARTYFQTQTGNPEILSYGTDYLSICSLLSFGAFGQITFERLLQSTGKTFYTMITQTTGAIVNVILDPIMIFGLFGFPRLEVAGAAIATVIGQVIAMTLAIIFNIRVNKEVTLKFRKARPDMEIIGKICGVGVPTAIMIAISSVMMFGLNKILMSFTSTAIAVFGVYFRLQGFLFMPIFGLNNGMVPIISYNYGARNRHRIVKTIRLSLLYTIAIMAVGVAIFEIFPRQLLSIFNASPDMISIGIPALRTISLSFVFAGFCIVSGSVFQALGRGMPSMIISTARQLLALLPLAYLMSRLGGLDATWWAFPMAETVSLTLTVLFLRHLYKTEIKPLPEG